MTSGYNQMLAYDPGRSNDYSLCHECNEAARLAVLEQTPAMREEQRQRRIAHFGNDGTPPKKLHREMVEGDLAEWREVWVPA
jgi:hypothetical protein